jgi:hypothetical protein
VTFAIFNKYPNPFAAHVLQSDVLSRTVTPNGILSSVRLHRKAGAVPSWGAGLFKAAPVAMILEDSTVDMKSKVMTTRTRNLEHRRFLFVEEIQEIRPHPEKSEW